MLENSRFNINKYTPLLCNQEVTVAAFLKGVCAVAVHSDASIYHMHVVSGSVEVWTS